MIVFQKGFAMIISKITTRNIGFSRSPVTLKRNLVTNASIFEDFETRAEGWFGPSMCTLVEVESEDGVVGIAWLRAGCTMFLRSGMLLPSDSGFRSASFCKCVDP